MELRLIDGLLVAVYVVFMLGLGFLLRRRIAGSADFFLAGRSMPAWTAGLAFLSTNLGAQEMIGMAALGHTRGDRGH
jgi:SSS family solute:Na+ symporter